MTKLFENNRFVIYEVPKHKRNLYTKRYRIYKKPLFRQFFPNTKQVHYEKCYKTYKSCIRYVEKNNDDLYRIQHFLCPTI